jgi:chromosomal replication initiator protein
MTAQQQPNPLIAAAEAVAAEIAKRHGMTAEELRSPSRLREYTVPRHLAVYFAVAHLGLTVMQAAKIVGRNQSSARNSLRSVADLTATDERFAARLKYLAADLRRASLIP